MNIFISKNGRFVLNLNHLSYIVMGDYDKPNMYVIGDTRPQPIMKEYYNELLDHLKMIKEQELKLRVSS